MIYQEKISLDEREKLLLKYYGSPDGGRKLFLYHISPDSGKRIIDKEKSRDTTMESF